MSGKKDGPKLRDSCVTCTSSKVRCSKDKPVCARCARRDLPCEYLPSRRTGRVSSKQAAANAAARASRAAGETTPSPSSTPPRAPPSAPTPVAVPAAVPAAPAAPAPAFPPDSSHHALAAAAAAAGVSSSYAEPMLDLSFLESRHDSVLFPDPHPGPSHDWDALFSAADSVMSTSPGLDDFLTSVTSNTLAHTPGIANLFQASDSSSHTSLWSLSDGSISADGSVAGNSASSASTTGLLPIPPCERGTTCAGSATAWLVKLIPGSGQRCVSAQSLDGTEGPRDITSVIQENRDIISDLGAILECPCAQSEYLLSIMILIVFKVVAWYAAAARGQQGNVETAPPAERVSHMPWTYGEYNGQGTEGGRMAAQLVLSELYRAQGLVNKISQRLQQHGSEKSTQELESANMSMTSPLSTNTLDSFLHDLRQCLTAASSETRDALHAW